MTDETGTLCDSICLQLDVPEEEGLTDLLQALSDADTSITVRSIIDTESPDRRIVPVDVDVLTDKQFEIALLALERGYYESPRRTTLDELADGVEISRSAASQRLRAGERRLIQETLGRFVRPDSAPENATVDRS